jgi:uncharacterized membrane protein YqjE
VRNDSREPANYGSARQLAALLLIGLVVVIVVIDVLTDDYRLSPSILVPLLLTVAGLLSVDLPRIGGPG